MNRVLVIGGSGFLGRKLMATCATDYAFTNFDVSRPDHGDVPFIEGNALDPYAVRDAVSHADAVWIRAGMLGGAPSRRVETCESYLRGNTEMVLNILDACRHVGCDRILFDSTEQVFGTSGDLAPQYADVEPTCMNFYGASKLICEKAIHMWAREKSSRSAQVFRYSRVRGVDSRDVIFHMVQACVRGTPLRILGNSSHRVAFVHVDDVMAANRTALGLRPNFAVYHVSSDRPYTLFELAQRIQAISDTSVPVRFEPGQGEFEPFVTGMAWEDTCCTLGWKPEKNLDDMIAETLRYVGETK